ncbi:MAG: PxKF domain-containing protein [Armatimonadota bacterium]|nr:PxKF domain-containing protein [Armatimonadota bacterium]MDR5696378.1 PxKF domain-containing protein [Armatimonadota bacterium]
MRRRTGPLLAAVVALIVGIPPLARADVVYNTLSSTAGASVTIPAGGSAVVGYYIQPTNTPPGDVSGCNATGSAPATVTLSVPSGVTANQTSLVFTGCAGAPPQSIGAPNVLAVTFSSSMPGSYTISIASVTGGRSGSLWDTSNATFTLVVTASVRPTQTAVVCVPNPVPVNAPTTCTATVTDTGSGTPTTPAGTVNWTGGAGSFSSTACTLSGSGNAASCQVTYTPNPGSVGAHSITATYAGDANHSGSSGNFSLTVAQRETSTAVACVPAAVFVNGNTTCTATVTDTSAGTAITPTGTVTFTSSLPGAFTGNPCTLSGSGNSASCQVSFNATAVGSHQINGTYSGDINHTGSGGSAALSVTYNFVGFLPPIMFTNPSPGFNAVRAGSTVPVKWRLLDANGAYVSALSAVVSIQVVPIHCTSEAEAGVPEEATATGGTSLRYDSTENQYVFNWQTQRDWGNHCYRLLLNLDDGKTHSADFRLR